MTAGAGTTGPGPRGAPRATGSPSATSRSPGSSRRVGGWVAARGSGLRSLRRRADRAALRRRHARGAGGHAGHAAVPRVGRRPRPAPARARLRGPARLPHRRRSCARCPLPEVGPLRGLGAARLGGGPRGVARASPRPRPGSSSSASRRPPRRATLLAFADRPAQIRGARDATCGPAASPRDWALLLVGASRGASAPRRPPATRPRSILAGARRRRGPGPRRRLVGPGSGRRTCATTLWARGYGGGHARDRDRLDARAGAPRRGSRRPIGDGPGADAASGSTCSPTSRTSTRPAPASTSRTSSGSARPGRDARPLAAIKRAASEVIVAEGATISHHHGVGPGPRAVPRRREGPAGDGGARGGRRAPSTRTGIMNPGVLLAGGRREPERDRSSRIDVGTQSVRAMVFDPRGTLLARAKVPIEPYVPGPPGCCEQDPELYWQAIGDACHAPVGAPGGAPRRDRGRRAHDPARHDRGHRRRRRAAPPGDRLARPAPRRGPARASAACGASRSGRAGVRRPSPTFRPRRGELDPRPRAGRLGRDPALPVPVRLPRPPPDRARSSTRSRARSATCPFDYKRLALGRPGDWRWQAVPIDRAWLPELVPPGGRLGEITARGGRGDRDPRRAAGDRRRGRQGVRGARLRRAGAARRRDLRYGTTATINTTHRRYVEVIPLVPPYPAAVPGAISLEVQVYRGFWMVEWFKREFGAAGGRAGRARWASTRRRCSTS